MDFISNSIDTIKKRYIYDAVIDLDYTLDKQEQK